MTKRIIDQIADLAMMTKRKAADSCQQPKSKSIEKCFNCEKKSHYVKDCFSLSKRKLDDEKTVEEAKQTQ